METFKRQSVPSVERMVTSDLIKKEIANKNSTVGREMEPYMKEHRHVPSELVVSTLLRNLDATWSNSVILDGFPRNLEQAEVFAQKTTDPDSFHTPQLKCIHLDIPRDWARAKAVGRLVCERCDFPYNDAKVVDGEFVWEADLPEKPKCGGGGCESLYPRNLIRRDSGEVFDKRYEVYLETERAVLDYMRDHYVGSVKEIRIRGGYRVMADEIIEETVASLGIEGLEMEELKQEAAKILEEWGS